MKEKKEKTAKVSKEQGNIGEVKSLFAKEFGKSAIMTSDTILDTQFVIPSSSLGLNMLLGCGGAPSGRIIELFGPEHGGKTFISLDFAINCQRAGKNVCFIDAEQALDISWAKKLGIDEKKLVWLRPESGEDAFDMIDTAIRSAQFGLIILDSVASLVPSEELEGKLDEVKNRMGLVAKMMSVGLRKITGYAARMGTSVIFVNQVRDNIGTTYGNPEITPGGRALKFYSSIRLRVNKVSKYQGRLGFYASKGDASKSDDVIIGQQINVSIEKNKMAAPVFQKAEFYMHYNSGIDTDKELMSIGSDLHLIEKKHGEEVFTFNGTEIDLIGEKKVTPEMFTTIKTAIMQKAKDIREGTTTPTSVTSIFGDALLKGVIVKEGDLFIFEDVETNSQKEFEQMITDDLELRDRIQEKITTAKIEL